jgi:acetyl esterase/lipase
MLTLLSANAIGQEKVVRLYQGPAPGSENWKRQEKENNNNVWRTRLVYNVGDPTITVFLPDPAKANGTGVIVFPGGGLHVLSIDSEGIDVAKWLNQRGVAAFVVKYRLLEVKTDDPITELMSKAGDMKKLEADVRAFLQLPTEDAKTAVKHVRQNAKAYGVNPNRIGVVGFSAGGTVIASLAYNYTPESRPDFIAPIYLQYEWVGKKQIPADAPPMFIVAATDDPLGLAPHSISLYNDWVGAKKTAELHLYSKGGHGFGMRKQNMPSDQWIERFAEWMKAQGLIDK